MTSYTLPQFAQEHAARQYRAVIASKHGGNGHGMRAINPVRIISEGAIVLAAFLSGFVIFEPAPYDIFLCLILTIGLLAGMRIPRSIVPLIVMFFLLNSGAMISSFMIADYWRGIMYVAVSLFLGLSSIFFAIVIANDPRRLQLIMRAYVISAVLTTIMGILGYFGVSGFSMFTRYQRAMGAFQDPNVYAPFLVIPILYLIHGVMNGTSRLFLVRAVLLLILLLGMFLAFSRAAWGLTAGTGLIFYLMLLINERNAKKRLKYIILGVVGVVAILLMILIALQFDAVSKLFAERAKAVQDYDGGRMGRFARHLIGYEMALTHPLGIAPLEFGYILKEDTHNNYVKAFMDYGWIGFIAWMTMTIWTTIGGFKLMFRQRPWQHFLQIGYIVFLGHTIIGNVIDTDHWRHFYLSIGIVWGCMALEKRWQMAHGETFLSKIARKSGYFERMRGNGTNDNVSTNPAPGHGGSILNTI